MTIGEGDGPPWDFKPDEAPRAMHEVGRLLSRVINQDLLENREGYDEADCIATATMIAAAIEAVYGESVLFVVAPNDTRAKQVFDSVLAEIDKSGKVSMDFKPPWRDE